VFFKSRAKRIAPNHRNIAIADAAWQSAWNQTVAKWNGAPQKQGVISKARTDGATGGASAMPLT